MTQQTTPSRRQVFSTGALVACSCTLAACGSNSTTVDQATSAAGSAASQAASAAGSAAGSAGSAAASAAGSVAAKLADIPVGSAVVKEIGGQPIVLAQPEAGKIVAYNAKCPHQGCTVAPKDGMLTCPCHGSTFELATGAVTKGPATSGLSEVAVTVSGDGISVG